MILRRSQIIRVSYAAGKAQKIAFVEFGDEEAMRAALGGHAEVSESSNNRRLRLICAVDIKRYDA